MQDMVAAGTITTYTVLEWAMTELIRHPRVMNKLRNELMETANGKSHITESDLVTKETFRLYPPMLGQLEETQSCGTNQRSFNQRGL